MCGIFGILTNKNITNKELLQYILNGLTRLQNRGYDSCGLGVIASEPRIYKYASTNTNNSLELLEKHTARSDICALEIKHNVGLGHNRWATHGPKTDENAHPHLSFDNKFMIVHNGIIENYKYLKHSLHNHQPDIKYKSQTDSEVVAHLLSHNYTKTNTTVAAIEKTINMLNGTYGLVIINTDEPDKLYCVRNGSPLLIGKTDNLCIVTSEQSGFNNQVNTYITLKNDDICTIELVNETIKITTTNIYREKNITNKLITSLTPEPFAHWTLKEIYEQPQTIQNSINMGGRIKTHNEVKLGGLDQHCEKLKLKNISHLILLGCGSSYNSALYGSYYFKLLCNFETVQVFDGAELSLLDLPKQNTTEKKELSVGFILISQSGETKDLYRCIELLTEYKQTTADSRHIVTMGVVNVVDSLIAREVDCGIYCNSGQEIGVASTKSFTSQVVCLSLVAIWFSQIQKINEILRAEVITSLQNLSNDYSTTLNEISNSVKAIATNILNQSTNLFILGKGTDQYIANESSLKIKEISYIHTEGYSASSLKHGPFALLDENFPVILLNCQQEHRTKINNCYEEIKSRGAPIIQIHNTETHPPPPESSTSPCLGQTLKVSNNKNYSSLLALIPLQLLSYYLSINKNLNPDKPKNLAKVVTVE
tara:strand:- start:921 stop:2876 length:1956 start_codon:yes stop_codon:yes gene_type:complete